MERLVFFFFPRVKPSHGRSTDLSSSILSGTLGRRQLSLPRRLARLFLRRRLCRRRLLHSWNDLGRYLTHGRRRLRIGRAQHGSAGNGRVDVGALVGRRARLGARLLRLWLQMLLSGYELFTENCARR